MKKKSEITSVAIKAGVFPTSQQTLLLKACLLNGPGAFSAMEDWLKTLGNVGTITESKIEVGLPQLYDRIDFGSQRLLSLLYKNITNQGFRHPLISQLAGYYKYVWYRNNLLKAQLETLSERLKSNDIEPIVFKGMIQTEVYYQDFGTRPTMDLDLIVRREQVDKTVGLLLKSGWQSKFGDPLKISKSLIHAHTFFLDSFELDVHTQFSAFPLLDVTIQSFWNRSSAWKNGLRILHPAHELFLTMLHGYQWNLVPPIRWVADCKFIIAGFHKSDMQVFLDLIHAERFEIPFQMMDYLVKNDFIDKAVWKNSRNEVSTSGSEMDEEIIYGLTPPSENEFAHARRLFMRTAYGKNKGVARRVSALLDHFLYVWNKRSYWHLISEGVRLTSKKALLQLKRRLAQ